MRNDPRQLSETGEVRLPGAARQVADAHPELWAAFQHLGEQTSRAGPLDERTRRLVHLAYAIGANSEGATHSHTRRGLSEGISPDELEHVALLAITTLGWPQAVRALTWIRDLTTPDSRADG